MNATRIGQRRLVLVLALIGLSIGGILLGLFFMVQSGRAQQTLQQNSGSPVVGTWTAEHGGVYNIRPDGTARWRSDPSDKEVGFFEWTLDSNQFTFLQFSSRARRYSFAGRLMRAQHALLGGEPTDRYELIEISPTQFQFRPATGDPVTFTKTEDRELEFAP